MKLRHLVISGAIGLGILSAACPAVADGYSVSPGLPSQAALQTALDAAVNAASNGGLGFNMWGTIVATDGTVCAVAFSGSQFSDQWLASRVISAQKANTANGLSLGEGSHMPASSHFPNGLALSTANLYSAVQPGGSLYGRSTAIRSTRRWPTPQTRCCSAPLMIHWSAPGSAASTCLAAVSCSWPKAAYGSAASV